MCISWEQLICESNCLSVMEWNIKTPSQWDWENLMIFNGKASEIPKQVQPTDWGIEGDGGIDNGSFYSSGGAGSGSDLGNGSSSKSSISASIDSSSKGGIKISEFNFETVEGFCKDLGNKIEFGRVEDTGTSPTMKESVVSGEPLIGLKLGKRTYFEDVCAASTVKQQQQPSFPANPTSSTTAVKRSRASYQSTQTPRCQVEGCNLDLTSAKDYHRRHRVCENHSKSPKVVVAGLERRFCQQCSRFHDIMEFDEKKRSCRRRLSDHNARRRKPQPEAIQFSSSRMPSMFYDGREQMNLLLNRTPVPARPAANPVWEGTYGFKPTVKGLFMRPAKAGSTDGQMHMQNNNMSKTISTICQDSDRLLSFKSTTAEVLSQGIEAPVVPSNLDATPDFRRALSLLSNTSWRSNDHEGTTLDQLMHANSNMAQSTMHVIPQGWPLASSEYWQAEPQVSLASQTNGISQFQEFQLFKAPFESGYYTNQMN